MNLKQLYNSIPQKWVRLLLFYTVTLAFILVNAYLLLKKDTLLGVLIPFGAAVLIAAVFSYHRLIWLIVFLAPVSVPLKDLYYGLPFDMHIPTEPLLFGILVLFIVSISRGQRIDREIVWHPVSKVVYFYLGWLFITTATSTLPLVSLKFLLAKIWYIVPFYFLLTYLFKEQGRILKFIWLFTVALIPVIIYATLRLYDEGLFNKAAAHWVMVPFFNDHTSYGAVLAMYIPFLVAFSLASWIPKKHKIWIWLLLIFFVAAEILSYSRAAWLSLIGTFGIWLIIRLKIKFKTIAITMVTLLLIVFTFQNQILMKLEENSTDSSSNLMEHVTSMTNISTDDSNLERINRWQSALGMFKEKPLFGWGPGTYSFNYAPFQLNSQRTVISTNSGDAGNAHSEYLGSLSEGGLIGMLSYIAIIIVVLITGINTYTRSEDKRIKTISLAAIASLSTYYLHGFLNNFLDMDKASIPFWGSMAIIVALDIYTRKQAKEKNSTKPEEA